ncbi:hypothetical protein [Bosea sp. (in: a-proteobacteria)]|uniref:hypothetical protein n=1 Tax=Bosea sp. (in: a-proteobacteria) TaxID=1871050 RepID=UPI002FC88940
MRLASSLLPASLLLALSFPAAAHAEAKFRLAVFWIDTEIEPEERVRNLHFTYLVTLGADKKVREVIERHPAIRRAGPSSQSREAQLGEVDGGRALNQWKVVNENTLVRLTGCPSHTFAIWLRTQGDRSCTASLEWRLKPGFTVYESWGSGRSRYRKFAEPTWPSAKCEVL